MRALLVNPEFPDSYWSGKHALPIANRRCLLPPLGLITVAAMLPRHWKLRVVDLNVQRLSDRAIRRADVVMLTGMIVQRESLHRILDRCKRLGVRTVVGGPYATSMPDDLAEADHVVVGESEELMEDLVTDLAIGKGPHFYRETDKPDLTTTPVPRFDLLKPGAYHQMCLQFSRGCPFTCEFCDIIVMYGRKPRTKAPAQVVAELEAIRATGFVGDVFFVDDNFIGNKKAVRAMLPDVAAWRRETRCALEFYTEASMNLADDDGLVDLMTDAGFTAVFIGIETPSPESLRETKKLQNLRRNLEDQVHRLLNRGLDVWGGFILGFDNDGPEIFDRMIKFVQKAAIPYAMVGLLGALPNTPLYRRLEKEGRLRRNFTGDQFGLTNVITKLPKSLMIPGYRKVMETLYHPEVYFQRCRENLARWNPVPGTHRPLVLRDLFSAWRALWAQGIRAPYRRAYWRFIRWTIRYHPAKLGRAIAQAAAGHHYITYTKDVVVPALEHQS